MSACQKDVNVVMLGSREDDGGHAAAALASAFECLQDADKVRDSAALADVLQCLGVRCDVRNLERFFRYSSTYNP